MKLNDIKNTGTWSDAAARLNSNFQKIEVETQKLNYATRKNKGYFLTLDALQTAVPLATDGNIAYVGQSSPYKIYQWSNGAWIDTGSTHTDTVNLGDYPTKAVLTVVENRLQEEIDSLAEGVNVMSDDIRNLEDAISNEVKRAKSAEESLGSEVQYSQDLAMGAIYNTGVASGVYPDFDTANNYSKGDIVRIDASLYKFHEDYVSGRSYFDEVADLYNIVKEIEDEMERAQAAEQEISRSIYGTDKMVEFDSYINGAITPTQATSTQAGGKIVYVRHPNNDIPIANGFFYLLNSTYYTHAVVDGVNVLQPYRNDADRSLYADTTYVCDGVKYVERNGFLETILTEKIPIFKHSTEEEIEDMIANDTWKEGVIYYTVEE